MANGKLYAVVAVVVVLTAVGLAGAAIVGLPMLLGGGDAETSTTATATTTATTEATTTTTATATTTATTTAATTTASTGERPSFAFTIDEIEECGSTCRDVTATLVNNGSAPADGVSVTVTVLADGDQLWQGSAEAGTLAAGEEFTTTKTVDVGFSGGAKIQANDGYVVIETVVEWDGGSETFRTREKVA